MKINISDISVDFPYQAYPLQIDYMKCVIESCNTGKYALLESPTGTGKTLSLLCSVLSWKNCKSKSTQIIYSSRTHSQLSNVIQELKKTNFKPTISQIAARSRLCLIPEVKSKDTSVQSKSCREFRQNKKCIYYDDQKIENASNELIESFINIEDFVCNCKKNSICPYYVSQKMAEKADLILTPYTYIIDPVVRNNLPGTLFHDNILIVDEVHNFPEQCCDYFSTSIPIKWFSSIKETINKLCGHKFADFTRGGVNFDLVSLNYAANQLEKLYNNLENLLKKNCITEKFVFKKSYFWYDLLEKSEITEKNIRGLSHLLFSISEPQVALDIQDIAPIKGAARFFTTIFPYEKKDMHYIDNNYGICLSSNGVINIFCFSPSVAFAQINNLKPKTIIMTSGTISPFESFISSLGFNFPILLENPHIADKKNLFISIASYGISGKQLNFNFQNRKDEEMINDLAACLNRAMNIVPSGFLAFFPSFFFLEEIESILKTKIQSSKKIIIEPRNQQFLKKSYDLFQKNAINGAALYAVCRGKMSEGIDFSNNLARCVCIVGIPFPNINDIKVDVHKQWLNNKQKGIGNKWYIENAMNAVNQSIGRAIRHKDDYAAIILLDQRFEGFAHMISKWMRPNIKIYNNWCQIEKDLECFFQSHHQTNFLSGFSQISSQLSESLTNNMGSSVANSIISLSSQSNASIGSSSNSCVQCSQIMPDTSSPDSIKNSSQDNEDHFLSSNSPPLKKKPELEEIQNTQIMPSSNSNENASNYSYESKEMQTKKVTFQNTQAPYTFDDPYSAFPKSQRDLVAPKISKPKIAAIHLKNELDKEEQIILFNILKEFKETHDYDVLKNGLNSLHSENCRKIIINIMSSNLKNKLGYS